MTKRIRYTIFGNTVNQNYTYINTENIFWVDMYNYISRVLCDRFKDYSIKINHSGRTVTITPKND